MSNSERPHGQTAFVQSVDRAATVLEILARQREAGVTEIAAELGVHKSTAFRIVAVLESHGLVEQTTGRGKYRLGFGIVRLAGAAAAQLDLAQESRAACEQLAVSVGETVSVAILDDGHSISISDVRGEASVASRSWIGRRTPLHATSTGKALLAFAPDDVFADLLGRPLEKFTSQTITDADELRTELERVRESGWASSTEELEVGLNAVAVPVWGDGDTVVAAVSVSGPSYRLGPESFATVATQVHAAATEISARLGHLGSRN